MTNYDQQPSPESLDPKVFSRFVQQYSRMVMRGSSRPFPASEAEVSNDEMQELFDPITGTDPIVGRERTVQVISGPFRWQLYMVLFDQHVVLGLEDTVHKVEQHGLPIGYMHVFQEEQEGGSINGIIDIHQRNYIKHDFALGSAPAEDPARQVALERFMDFVGLDHGFQNGERPKIGDFNNGDLNNLLAGLERVDSADPDGQGIIL